MFFFLDYFKKVLRIFNFNHKLDLAYKNKPLSKLRTRAFFRLKNTVFVHKYFFFKTSIIIKSIHALLCLGSKIKIKNVYK